jgi:hypothetical protein
MLSLLFSLTLIRYTIHGKLNGLPNENFNRTSDLGGKDLDEIELEHLDGHKGSKPVRCVHPNTQFIEIILHNKAGIGLEMVLLITFNW